MASIFEQVYSLSGYEREHLFRIITSLDAAGFDLHSKREGFVLRHINTDSLPFLNDSERATLRHLATGMLLGFSHGAVQSHLPLRRGAWGVGTGDANNPQQSLCLNQLPCNVYVMQENHGVVRWDLGCRDRRPFRRFKALREPPVPRHTWHTMTMSVITYAID